MRRAMLEVRTKAKSGLLPDLVNLTRIQPEFNPVEPGLLRHMSIQLKFNPTGCRQRFRGASCRCAALYWRHAARRHQPCELAPVSSQAAMHVTL